MARSPNANTQIPDNASKQQLVFDITFSHNLSVLLLACFSLSPNNFCMFIVYLYIHSLFVHILAKFIIYNYNTTTYTSKNFNTFAFQFAIFLYPNIPPPISYRISNIFGFFISFNKSKSSYFYYRWLYFLFRIMFPAPNAVLHNMR